MVKFTVDYYKEEEVKGGVQSVFSQFKSIDDGFKNLSYFDAGRVLGFCPTPQQLGLNFEFCASLTLDRYLRHYEDLFGIDLIVRNSIVGSFERLEAPQICVLQDNNIDGPDTLRRLNLYDPLTWYRLRHEFTALQRRSMESARAIVAVSKDIARAYEREFNVKCEVIEHGVDLDKFYAISQKDELKEKYGIPKDKKIGLFVGSFHPVSNYHFIPPLIRNLKDIFWVICFKHPTDYRPRLENVKLLCNIERNRMNEIYNLADFLISPSYVESFNLKAVEAMACDLPVIVTKTGYFAEFDEGVHDFGIVVERPDVELFEKAINEMLHRAYIFRGRMHIEDNELDLESWRLRWRTLIEGITNK